MRNQIAVPLSAVYGSSSFHFSLRSVETRYRQSTAHLYILIETHLCKSN